MRSIISKLLKNLYQYDRKRRKDIVKKCGPKMALAEDKLPFYVFKGEIEERIRIVLFLVDNKALSVGNDFYYAAAILITSDKLKHFITACLLIKKYRELGGKKYWNIQDAYLAKQNWGKTKEEIFKQVEKKIGINPKKLNTLK